MGWTFVVYWLLIAGLAAGSLVAAGSAWAGAMVLTAASSLLLRARRVGVYASADGDIRCVDWFSTKTYRGSEVLGVRVDSYCGLGNRFSESRLFGMVVVDLVSGRSVRVRATVAHGRALRRRVSGDR